MILSGDPSPARRPSGARQWLGRAWRRGRADPDPVAGNAQLPGARRAEERMGVSPVAGAAGSKAIAGSGVLHPLPVGLEVVPGLEADALLGRQAGGVARLRVDAGEHIVFGAALADNQRPPGSSCLSAGAEAACAKLVCQGGITQRIGFDCQGESAGGVAGLVQCGQQFGEPMAPWAARSMGQPEPDRQLAQQDLGCRLARLHAQDLPSEGSLQLLPGVRLQDMRPHLYPAILIQAGRHGGDCSIRGDLAIDPGRVAWNRAFKRPLGGWAVADRDEVTGDRPENLGSPAVEVAPARAASGAPSASSPHQRGPHRAASAGVAVAAPRCPSAGQAAKGYPNRPSVRDFAFSHC